MHIILWILAVPAMLLYIPIITVIMLGGFTLTCAWSLTETSIYWLFRMAKIAKELAGW